MTLDEIKNEVKFGSVIKSDHIDGIIDYVQLISGSVSPLKATGSNSIISIDPVAAKNGELASNSIFIGKGAGDNAAVGSSNFLGIGAGSGSSNAHNCNFFGYGAGTMAIYAHDSNFFGQGAGIEATNAMNSNFFGEGAGSVATEANNSNFFGVSAGSGADSASFSNFFGESAGSGATNAEHSNFIGQNAGTGAISASYSNLFGYSAGQKIYGNGNGIGSNNIIIGTNITLENDRVNSINLGGIIFATGSYSTTTGMPSSGSVSNGKVGIGISVPKATLHVVSGSGDLTPIIIQSTRVFADNATAVAGGLTTSGSLYRTSTGVLMVTY